MNKKQKIKYIIAIYSIVLCISIILTILAYNREDGAFSEALLLNLATELLGVVLVFFLVNFLFSIDDWDLNEKIRELIASFEDKENVRADNFFHDKEPIKDKIRSSAKIDLCGVALSTTIDSHLSDLRDFIRAGGHLRILVMETSEENLKTASNRSEVDDQLYYQKKLDSTRHNIRYLSSNTKEHSEHSGILEVGLLAYPPSIGIQKFEAEGTVGSCIIEMYSHHIGWGEPPNFTLSSGKDEKWYRYFSNQFEAMWDKSKKIEEIEENS